MKYNEVLLNKLASIYEKRDANSSKLNRPVKIIINKNKFPEYFCDVAGYDESIQELNNMQYINIQYYPHDTVIKSISLNMEKIDEIKNLLGVNGVKEQREKLLNELSKYNDDIIVRLKQEIENRIYANKSIKQYLNDDFIDALKAVHYLENMEHDIYERNASNQIFNDSKKLNKLKLIIESIYDDDNIFEKKGILTVTPYIYLKGDGVIKVNNQIINLSDLKTSIGLPIDQMDSISFERIAKVTTIENLTTFYNYTSDGLIIYLGGFSTHSQIKVLKKIKCVCERFYHFGDIDFGGFTILNNLMEQLEIKITAINMKLDTLKSNIKYAQSFNDDKYIDKLKTLLNKPLLSPYYDVIQYLIDNKVRLEQESFYNI